MQEKRKIGIVGAGAMGAGIAQVAAKAGHRVVLIDQSKDALARTKVNQYETGKALVAKGKWTVEEAAEVSKNLSYSESFENLNDASLVIEAIVENLQAKKALFGLLEEMVAADCVLATNTSSLSITAIAAACKKPGRVVGMHFFNPASIMPLVEIIPGLQTQEQVLSKATQMAEQWGKSTVHAKDLPGFIVNRLARPFYAESLRILEEGIANVATIDWALTSLAGFKMGPFALMDFIGNDVNYAVTESVFTATYYDARYRPSVTQKRLVEAGFLGKKTNRGFYDYEKPMPKPLTNIAQGKIIEERVVAMLINEAAEGLRMHLASEQDLEKAMVMGVGYPKGLLVWANDWGIHKCVNKMEELENRYCEDRYRCSPLLKEMAVTGAIFTNF